MQKLDLGKMLASYQLQQEDIQRTQLMFQAIAEVMAPFRGTEIIAYLSDDIDYFRRTVVVEMKNLPGIVLKHTWSRDEELDMFDDPTKFYWNTGVALGEQFKAIPRIEPEVNIILGEE